jgi:hypothetical protein
MMHGSRSLRRAAYYCIIVLSFSGLPAKGSIANGDHNAPFPIEHFVADYYLRSKGMNIAAIRYQLSQHESQLVFTSIARPKGLATWISSTPVTEKSLLEWYDKKLLPQQYYRQHTGKPDAKVQNLQIDYDHRKNQAIALLGNEKYSFEIGQGLWDEASLILAIMTDLKQGLTDLNYRLIDDGELKSQHYTIENTELIDTAIGSWKAVKIVRTHGNRKTLMWWAPDLDYLLLKVQQYRKDKLKSEMLVQSTTNARAMN